MKCIGDIATRGKIPVVVGGTGLYVDTLIYNTEFLDFEIDYDIRKKLYSRCEEEGVQALWNELNEIDPDAASSIHVNNSKKIIRALEVYYQTGKTITQQNELSRINGSPIDPFIIALNADNRDYLYDRINRRVDIMVGDGLLDEAESYFGKYSEGTSVQAIGYKELLPYLKKEKTLEECLENLKMQTRRYAKRQLTWFRKNENINWLYIDRYKDGNLSEAAINLIKERGFI